MKQFNLVVSWASLNIDEGSIKALIYVLLKEKAFPSHFERSEKSINPKREAK